MGSLFTYWLGYSLQLQTSGCSIGAGKGKRKNGLLTSQISLYENCLDFFAYNNSRISHSFADLRHNCDL